MANQYTEKEDLKWKRYKTASYLVYRMPNDTPPNCYEYDVEIDGENDFFSSAYETRTWRGLDKQTAIHSAKEYIDLFLEEKNEKENA